MLPGPILLTRMSAGKRAGLVAGLCKLRVGVFPLPQRTPDYLKLDMKICHLASERLNVCSSRMAKSGFRVASERPNVNLLRNKPVTLGLSEAPHHLKWFILLQTLGLSEAGDKQLLRYWKSFIFIMGNFHIDFWVIGSFRDRGKTPARRKISRRKYFVFKSILS